MFVTNPLLKLVTYTLYNRTTKIMFSIYSLCTDYLTIHKAGQHHNLIFIIICAQKDTDRQRVNITVK